MKASQMANFKWHMVFLPFALCLLPCRSSLAYSFNDLDMDKVVSGSAKLVKAAVGLSDQEEIKVGRDVAANFAARYGLVDDPAKLRYVNLVGQALVLKCRRND